MLGPILAGLAGTLLPALRDGAFGDLAGWAGLGPAVRLSLVTGVGATVASLSIAMAVTAALYGTPAFMRIERMLAPLLSLPHAAAALGLALHVGSTYTWDWGQPSPLGTHCTRGGTRQGGLGACLSADTAQLHASRVPPQASC